ncbi:MAG: hypothetical protein K5896_04680 [Prevotella sp.]|nr:hypothetical protein [Prevotella sp.]
MKKLFFLTMSALLVLGCNTKSSSSKGEEEEETRELKTKVFEYEKNTSHSEAFISIEFPVGGDEELGDSIYNFIVSTMKEQQAYEDDLDDYRNDGQGLVDLFGKKISADLEEGWQSYTGGDETMSDVLNESAKYNILEDNDKYITYLYEYDCYYGGDGYMNRVGATFLKDDCSRINNDFLFKNSSSDKLLSLVVNVLKEKYCEGEFAFLEESELDGIEALPQAPFYITKDGLAFYYHMYEVHWSALEGILPWDKVKNLLTDEAQELF